MATFTVISVSPVKTYTKEVKVRVQGKSDFTGALIDDELTFRDEATAKLSLGVDPEGQLLGYVFEAYPVYK